MVILTGCTWGCLSLWERPRLSWQQQLSHLHRPAGLRWVPPSPKPASFHSGCAIPDRWQPLSAGWREGAWAAALSCPSALLPAQGSWQSGEPRADEQAVCGQSSPLGSLGAGGGPVMPVLAAEEVQLNPPTSGCLRGRTRKGQRRWWRLRLEAAVCERRGWQGWRQKVVDFLVHLTPWLTVLMTFNYKGHCHGCSPTLLCLTCAMRKQP